MNASPDVRDCRAPIDFDALIAYWLGELDDAQTARVDEHLIGCDACGARLDEIVALGAGVRAAFDAGFVGTVVGAAFTRRLAERGLRLREYRVERDGGVDCSVAPEDDVVISRLVAPLAGIERLDLLRRHGTDAPETRAPDIPFDAASGEIVLIAPAALLRELPVCEVRFRLVAVDAAGERPIGDYTMRHRPHGAAR